MDWGNIINIAAIALSPLVAVWANQVIEDRKELKKRKFNIFISLISSRHRVINEDLARAFNSIDVVFAKSKEIRKLWKEYFALLSQRDRINEWGKKKLELLKVMADDVGYAKVIDHLDLDRIYTPEGLTQNDQRRADLENRLIKFLDRVEVIGLSEDNSASTPSDNSGRDGGAV